MDKKKVLIVDDSDYMRFALTRLLNGNGGFEATSVASGEKAIEMYRNMEPDIVLMDIAMPGGMDGIVCTRNIRTINPRAKVIMISTLSDIITRIQAERAGACGFVAKPFKAEELFRVISQ